MNGPKKKPTDAKKGLTPEELERAVKILKPSFLKRLKKKGILIPKKHLSGRFGSGQVSPIRTE